MISADSDGGLASNFSSVFSFIPPALPGYSWIYGQHPNDGSSYANMYYVCMQPGAAADGNTEALPSVLQAAPNFSQGQYIYNTSCGATTNTTSLSSSQMHLTLYLTYNPNIAPPA